MDRVLSTPVAPDLPCHEGGNASSPHNASLFFTVTRERGERREERRIFEGGEARVTFVSISIFWFSFLVFFPTRVSEFSRIVPPLFVHPPARVSSVYSLVERSFHRGSVDKNLNFYSLVSNYLGGGDRNLQI